MKAAVIFQRDDGKVVMYEAATERLDKIFSADILYFGEVGHRTYSSPRGLYDAIEDFCKQEAQ